MRSRRSPKARGRCRSGASARKDHPTSRCPSSMRKSGTSRGSRSSAARVLRSPHAARREPAVRLPVSQARVWVREWMGLPRAAQHPNPAAVRDFTPYAATRQQSFRALLREWSQDCLLPGRRANPDRPVSPGHDVSVARTVTFRPRRPPAAGSAAARRRGRPQRPRSPPRR
jgi:hypothetical protein